MLLYILFCLGTSLSHALEAGTEKYDSVSYSVVAGSKNLVYLNECTRSKLKQFEWKAWEGNWSIRARIQPIATIRVKLGPDDPFMDDVEEHIKMSIESSQKIGGHILCMVKIERDPQTVMVRAVTFRAYRQMFISGNQNWENYLNEIVSKGLPLTLQDFRAIVKSP